MSSYVNLLLSFECHICYLYQRCRRSNMEWLWYRLFKSINTNHIFTYGNLSR